jgi:hypothetical protein
VKLGFYLVRKRYKNEVYEHELVLLRFPKELHELLRCLRDQKVVVKAAKEGNVMHIMLIEKQ